MHLIPRAPRACILLREGCPPLEFASREAAFAFLGPAIAAGRLGKAFAPAEYRANRWGYPVLREAITHVLIDVATWTPLPASVFEAWMPQHRSWRELRYAGWSGAGPVPHTGRPHRGSAYRSMRTHRSRRQSVEVDDGEVPGRPRAWKNLPSAWDDVVRGDLGQRSWKRQRRAQWRER